MDLTFIRGSKCINSIVATYSLLDFVEGSKLLEAYEITITDYRSFIIDINMERYFNYQLSIWDKIKKRKLNPARRSYRNKFVKMLEEQLN